MLEKELNLLSFFEDLALEAGREILQHFRQGFTVESKADASPVTAADHSAERIILAGLAARLPDIPCVAEEKAAAGIIPDCGDCFLLVDPLDGTREFINRRPDFTVNIALIRGGVPVLGVVHAPARGLLFSGGGDEAFEVEFRDAKVTGRKKIRARAQPASAPVILASLSHRTPETDAFIARFPESRILSIGSSLKFCLLARGDADQNQHFGPTMQWDTAAGDAILRAAGGMTRDLDGAPQVYGSRGENGGFRNPFFIAEGVRA